MSSTGSIQSAAPSAITDMNSDELQISFTNDSGTTLTPGQEVTLKTDGTVDVRDAGTDKPLGVVVVGGANGARVTVRILCTMIINAIATGSTLDAGALVKPNGVKNSDNYPQYVAIADGDYVSAMVIKGGVATSTIKVGILNAPFRSTAP